MHFRMIRVGAAAVFALAACTDQPLVAPSGQPTLSKSVVVDPSPPAPWAKIVTGQTGPASVYELYIPANWNGDAVFYAHGIRSPYAPVGPDDTQDSIVVVRNALGAMGYAIAYSSFDENGVAVKDGAERTHQLRGLLASQLNAQPRRSFLLGFSLGGAIALDLAETYPKQYDGAVTMCGMVGGTSLELQYIGDVRALFDYFYPGVLPGNVVSVPAPPMTMAEFGAKLTTALSANPMGLFAIASTAQTPLAYYPNGDITNPSSDAFQSLVQSLGTALYNQLVSTPSVESLTHGHSPYGNRGVTYTLGTAVIPPLAPVLASMIAGADAGVTRYDIPRDARNYLDRYYTPTGHLTFPVVTSHALWDNYVPYFHETALAGIVQAAGTSDMLLQRSLQLFTHCDFPAAATISSFQTMVDWVNTGNKPAN